MKNRYGDYTKSESLMLIKDKICKKDLINNDGERVPIISLKDVEEIDLDIPGYLIFPNDIIYPIVNGSSHHEEFKKVLSLIHNRNVNYNFQEAFIELFKLNIIVYVGVRRNKSNTRYDNFNEEVKLYLPYGELTEFQKESILKMDENNDLDLEIFYRYPGESFIKLDNLIERIKKSVKIKKKVNKND